MASFTWKLPEQLADTEAREAPQDLETRYAGKKDLDAEGVRAWDTFVLELSEPVGALETFLKTVRALQRPLMQKRVFISHRMGTAPWAERIAWLASQSAGLDYWLDVHDPVLRRATTPLPPTDPRYAAAIAAIIEMALLNCTHVIAMHTPPPASSQGQAQPPWIPSQWIPYEIGRAKSRTVYSGQMAGWFHKDVKPDSRGEYVLLGDLRFSDSDVETWLISHGTDARNNTQAQKCYLGTGKPIPPVPLPI